MSRSRDRQRRSAAHRAGKWAEWLALLVLLAKAYRPLAWRYKTPYGEIDLVMRRGEVLVFVEVKGRADAQAALWAVGPRNQARVVRAAQQFIATHPQHASCTLRFDVVTVAWYGRLQHHPNSFGALA